MKKSIRSLLAARRGSLRRKFLRLLASAAVLGGAGAEARAVDTVDYVIQIGIDGLRGDLLRDLVASSPATYPNFFRLQSEGASTYQARSDYFYTETVPNHITMITGRPAGQPAGQPNTVHHGYTNNFPATGDTIHDDGNDNVPYKASTFDVVHDNGFSTALYTSKTRLTILDESFNATNGAADTTGADNGTDKIDFSMIENGSSAGITGSLVTNQVAAPKKYTFLHLVEPDSAGHSTGWGGAQWSSAVATVDARLGLVLAMINANPAFAGHTALVVTGDHGGTGNNHTTASQWENFTVPFFVWGAGLEPGSDLYAALSNRFNPGPQTRVAYDDAQQPIRNGDAPNISLALLGLPPIPGSFLLPTFAAPPPAATVAGRHIFYNNSKFDGNTPEASAADDAAIAPDKAALLPGGTASFANYTSYSRGINGLMIDVDDLANPAGISADDFLFRVGNSENLAEWTAGPAPLSVTVRPADGVGDSDRIEIVWADGAITKKWLQVTSLANADTGLSEDDVFYFGNAVGETGNSTTNAVVNAGDEIGARVNSRNPLNPAPIDFPYDFNRDGLVNANDQILARVNSTNPLSALDLLELPPAPSAAALSVVPEPSSVLLAGLGLAGAAAVGVRRRSATGRS